MVKGEESRMQGIMSPQSKDSPDNRSRQVKSSNLGHKDPWTQRSQGITEYVIIFFVFFTARIIKLTILGVAGDVLQTPRTLINLLLFINEGME